MLACVEVGQKLRVGGKARVGGKPRKARGGGNVLAFVKKWTTDSGEEGMYQRSSLSTGIFEAVFTIPIRLRLRLLAVLLIHKVFDDSVDPGGIASLVG